MAGKKDDSNEKLGGQQKKRKIKTKKEVEKRRQEEKKESSIAKEVERKRKSKQGRIKIHKEKGRIKTRETRLHSFVPQNYIFIHSQEGYGAQGKQKMQCLLKSDSPHYSASLGQGEENGAQSLPGWIPHWELSLQLRHRHAQMQEDNLIFERHSDTKARITVGKKPMRKFRTGIKCRSERAQ